MADSWQKICFIWPICIKVAGAITRARQRDKLKKKIQQWWRRRQRRCWAYNKSPVQIGAGENFKKGADIKSSSDCLSTGWGNDCFIIRPCIVLSRHGCTLNPFILLNLSSGIKKKRCAVSHYWVLRDLAMQKGPKGWHQNSSRYKFCGRNLRRNDLTGCSRRGRKMTPRLRSVTALANRKSSVTQLSLPPSLPSPPTQHGPALVTKLSGWRCIAGLPWRWRPARSAAIGPAPRCFSN